MQAKEETHRPLESSAYETFLKLLKLLLSEIEDNQQEENPTERLKAFIGEITEIQDEFEHVFTNIAEGGRKSISEIQGTAKMTKEEIITRVCKDMESVKVSKILQYKDFIEKRITNLLNEIIARIKSDDLRDDYTRKFGIYESYEMQYEIAKSVVKLAEKAFNGLLELPVTPRVTAMAESTASVDRRPVSETSSKVLPSPIFLRRAQSTGHHARGSRRRSLDLNSGGVERKAIQHLHLMVSPRRTRANTSAADGEVQALRPLAKDLAHGLLPETEAEAHVEPAVAKTPVPVESPAPEARNWVESPVPKNAAPAEAQVSKEKERAESPSAEDSAPGALPSAKEERPVTPLEDSAHSADSGRERSVSVPNGANTAAKSTASSARVAVSSPSRFARFFGRKRSQSHAATSTQNSPEKT